MPAKAISLINFVNSRRQVQVKNVGHYLMAEFSFEKIISKKYVFQEYKSDIKQYGSVQTILLLESFFLNTGHFMHWLKMYSEVYESV